VHHPAAPSQDDGGCGRAARSWSRHTAIPAGFSTIKDLAERYGYSWHHLGRLIAGGAMKTEFNRVRCATRSAQRRRSTRSGMAFSSVAAERRPINR
jgi:hypothetical protein